MVASALRVAHDDKKQIQCQGLVGELLEEAAMQQLMIHDRIASGPSVHARRLQNATCGGYRVLYLAKLAGMPEAAPTLTHQAYLVLYLTGKELLR